MQKLLDSKGRILGNDPWQTLPVDFEGSLAGIANSGDQFLLPLQYWLDHASELDLAPHASIGIWLDSDTELDAIAEHLPLWSCIGIHFQSFMDGRGFSLARLIRERCAYKGELRAFGHIIPDQLYYLARCGFDTFLLEECKQDFDPQPYFDSFSVTYQTSTEQPEPLFRRRS